jgi:hypothetical protein
VTPALQRNLAAYSRAASGELACSRANHHRQQAMWMTNASSRSSRKNLSEATGVQAVSAVGGQCLRICARVCADPVVGFGLRALLISLQGLWV